MTPKQRHARNDAYQLLKVAERILNDAGLTADASDVEAILIAMKRENEMLVTQEVRRRTPA